MQCCPSNGQREEPVHHTSQSRKATQALKSVQAALGRNDAPVLVLCVSGWKDGFGPGKCKNNRNSVDLQTITIGSPRDRVNATNNTFPVALGEKSGGGWKEVMLRAQKAVKDMSDPKKPYLVYHGHLRKIIGVVLVTMAQITNRVEKALGTGTLGHSGATHQRYGHAGTIQRATCLTNCVQSHMNKEVLGKAKPRHGWSEGMLSQIGEMNGAVPPPCIDCRNKNLRAIGIKTQKEPSSSSCKKCANWKLSNLRYNAHKDYPTHVQEGCPVDPPTGRSEFSKNGSNRLPFIKMEWPVLIHACKFAFYQSSRPKGWTKACNQCYLKNVGVATEFADQVHASVKRCAHRKE